MKKLYDLAYTFNCTVVESRGLNIYTLDILLSSRRIIFSLKGPNDQLKDIKLKAFNFLTNNYELINQMNKQSYIDFLLNQYPSLKEISNIKSLFMDINIESDLTTTLISLIKLISVNNTLANIKIEENISIIDNFIDPGKLALVTIENEQYLGISVGDLPRKFKPTINNLSLEFCPIQYSPYFYIFNLKKFIWGSDCFWVEIKDYDTLFNSLDYSLESASILKILKMYF